MITFFYIVAFLSIISLGWLLIASLLKIIESVRKLTKKIVIDAIEIKYRMNLLNTRIEEIKANQKFLERTRDMNLNKTNLKTIDRGVDGN